MDDFRNICSQAKEIQISNNARLKRGRKPTTPAQEPHEKRKPTIATEFTTRHFQTTSLPPADQAAHEECSSELRVQISSLFEQLRATNARDILPLRTVQFQNRPSPPPPRQTPGHLTFLKKFGQIPPLCCQFRGSNAPPVRASKRVKSPTLQGKHNRLPLEINRIAYL